MDIIRNQRIEWTKKIIGCLRGQVKKQIIEWLEEQDYCGRIIAFVLRLMVVPVLGIWVAYLFFSSVKSDENSTEYLIWLTAGVVGWYFLFRRTKAAELTAKATEQGLTVDRLTHATGQLKNKKLFIRLGGVLSLEQIAVTNEEESEKIAHVFASFIRKKATKDSEKILETKEQFSAHRMQRLDIEASVNALARITSNLEKRGRFQDHFKETKYHLCNLQGVDLRGLRFVKTDLTEFDLARVDLGGARLIKTILSRANLNSANLSDVQAEEIVLVRTNLADADLSRARLEGANASKVNLMRANLTEVRLAGADLANAELNEAVLIEADLMGANLADAELNEANLAGADLMEADLRNAELNEANFSNALLLGANLNNAHLESVDFSDATLGSAILDGANIKDAVLKNTDVSFASFDGIEGLTQEQINGTFCWKNGGPAGLPDKLKPPLEKDSYIIEDE